MKSPIKFLVFLLSFSALSFSADAQSAYEIIKKAEDIDEPTIYKDSISPFSQAVNKVEISIDWVQFVKEAK